MNVYVPNERELTRLPYRQQWDRDFLAYLKALEKKKPVIFCGDLNVAHTEIDLANPKANMKNHGFTPEERAGFTSFVQAGFVDTFREFEKVVGITRGGARWARRAPGTSGGDWTTFSSAPRLSRSSSAPSSNRTLRARIIARWGLN